MLGGTRKGSAFFYRFFNKSVKRSEITHFVTRYKSPNVTNGIVDAGTAVVLKSTDNPVMTLTDDASGDTQTNNLKGP